MQVKKAIIPAAGLGTRFLPATKAQPKEMLPIVDKPVIQYIVEEAVSSGIEDIIIVTGRNKRSIEDHFDRSIELELELEKKQKYDILETVQNISNLVNVHYVRQKEPLGLGNAILCAKSFIHNEPFAVMLGDDIVDSKVPCLKQLIEVYNNIKSPVIGIQEVPNDMLHKYGVIDPSSKNIDNSKLIKINSLVEKPKISPPSNFAVMGRYILTPETFHSLENISLGAGNEYQLTDALNVLSNTQSIYGYLFDGKRYDTGNIMGFLEATIELAMKRTDIKDEFINYLKKIH